MRDNVARAVGRDEIWERGGAGEPELHGAHNADEGEPETLVGKGSQ